MLSEKALAKRTSFENSSMVSNRTCSFDSWEDFDEMPRDFTATGLVRHLLVTERNRKNMGFSSPALHVYDMSTFVIGTKKGKTTRKTTVFLGFVVLHPLASSSELQPRWKSMMYNFGKAIKLSAFKRVSRSTDEFISTPFEYMDNNKNKQRNLCAMICTALGCNVSFGWVAQDCLGMWKSTAFWP